jgi:hypothetical protein
MKNQCCELAELVEVNAPGAPNCIIALFCPVCGEIEPTSAWDKLNDRVKHELATRRVMPLSA